MTIIGQTILGTMAVYGLGGFYFGGWLGALAGVVLAISPFIALVWALDHVS